MIENEIGGGSQITHERARFLMTTEPQPQSTAAELACSDDESPESYDIQSQSRCISTAMDALLEKGFDGSSADTVFVKFQRMRHHCHASIGSISSRRDDWREYHRLLTEAIKLSHSRQRPANFRIWNNPAMPSTRM